MLKKILGKLRWTMIWNKWSNFLCWFIDVRFSFLRNWIWQKFQVDRTPCPGLTAAPELHTPTEPIRIRTDRTLPRAFHAPICPQRRRFVGLPRRTRRAEPGSPRSKPLAREKHVSAGGMATRPGRLQRRRGARSPLPTCHYCWWWADCNVSISL
jgi:hypothetical protein